MNTDLKALIELHTHNALESLTHHKKSTSTDNLGININQKNLMISALEINKITASEIMIDIDNVYMMDYDHPIGKKELKELLEKGFSRIPVYEDYRTNLVGVLRIKQLIGINFSTPKSIRELNLKLKMPLIIDPSMKIYDILAEFRKGKSHMAILTEGYENIEKVKNVVEKNWNLSMNSHRFNGNLSEGSFNTSNEHENEVAENIDIEGILTLEDVIENIIKVKILDEDDYEKIKEKFKISKIIFYFIFLIILFYFLEKLNSKKLAMKIINEQSLKIEDMIRVSHERGSNRRNSHNQVFDSKFTIDNNKKDKLLDE